MLNEEVQSEHIPVEQKRHKKHENAQWRIIKSEDFECFEILNGQRSDFRYIKPRKIVPNVTFQIKTPNNIFQKVSQLVSVIHWGSEYWTSLEFNWSKVVRSQNGLLFEWWSEYWTTEYQTSLLFRCSVIQIPTVSVKGSTSTHSTTSRVENFKH